MSDIDKQLDNFITRWCGENAAHLLDNDENDGQRLRDYIAQQVREARIYELEKISGFSKATGVATVASGTLQNIQDRIAALKGDDK
jgi:hypothetical protein